MSKLSEIFEGWKNHISPPSYLEQQITQVSAERMEICKACPLSSMNNPDANPFRFDDHCTKCGCPLVTKTKSLSSSCPIEKWVSVITPEEEQTIENHEKG